MARSWLAHSRALRPAILAVGVLISACRVPEFTDAPLCSDGELNGGETDVDCGGSCQPCGVGKFCKSNTDCLNVSCTDGRCMEGHCKGGILDPKETDTDCGGGECPPCDNGKFCAVPSDCESQVCTVGVCRAALCSDKVKDGNETDVDCGGKDCSKCQGGKACKLDGDCASNLCESGICAARSCDDGLKNGAETDVDCGGPDEEACKRCALQERCLESSDCETGVCAEAVCVDASCTDEVTNGNETDLNCGGTDCSKCGDGKTCVKDSDCGSQLCRDAVCQTSTCEDLRKNGGETGIDCGGECMALCQPNQSCTYRCVTGEGCKSGNDCGSSVCTESQCQAPLCTDGAKNGIETDIDCGGGSCGLCAVDRACLVDSDCATAKCIGNKCALATCGDTVQNGTESDIDCGGSCPGCASNKRCTSDSDCQSRICNGQLCAEGVCGDGVQNGTETDVDCGGGSCGPCADVGQKCAKPSDCATVSCVNGACAAPSCQDAVQNGTETGLNCGGSCSPCTDGLGCKQGSDCQSGVCASSICQVSKCPDGVKNGLETDVDCGGGGCPTCDHYQGCRIDADCESTFCSRSPITAATGTCQDPRCGDGYKNATETDVDCGGYCADCPDTGFCLADTDCQSQKCVNGVCQYGTCSDTFTNPPETDLNCGGGAQAHANGEICSPCPNGSICKTNDDCRSKVCAGSGTTLTCQGPTCQDGTQNGDETGRDCGGSCVGVKTGCADGLGCKVAVDCRSGVCGTDNLCQVPSCTDRVKNGTETDVDCDGASCSPCPDGAGCSNGTNCQSKICDPTTKLCSVPTCTDLAPNGSETGVDCGGSNNTCPRCGLNVSCIVDADCDSAASLVCHATRHICALRACDDLAQNGEETDVDCGGSLCSPCSDGAKCSVTTDCTSHVCSGTPKICQVPNCSDTVLNGQESALDCGGGLNADGTACKKCTPGQACRNGANCDSGVCSASLICQDPSCSDGVTNGGELAVDCAGPCLSLSTPQKCPNGTACTSDAQCTTGVCATSNHLCSAQSCSDGHKNQNESDVDCGGSCTKCATGRACTTGTDCVTGGCESSQCVDLPCTGLCSPATVFTTVTYSSGSLGVGATCHETKAQISGMGCTEFGTKLLSMNGATAAACNGNVTLPARRNGGFCIQTSGGDKTYAAFNTW